MPLSPTRFSRLWTGYKTPGGTPSQGTINEAASDLSFFYGQGSRLSLSQLTVATLAGSPAGTLGATSISTLTVSAAANVTGATLIVGGIQAAAPASGNSSGVTGQLASDMTYFYYCRSTNSWSRISLNNF